MKLVLFMVFIFTSVAVNAEPIDYFKEKILNNVYLGIDGPDGGNSRMACYDEEDYDAPLNADGSRPKAIICWRSDNWHGLAGINRGWPVKLRVDPDVDTFKFVRNIRNFSNLHYLCCGGKGLLTWEALWTITCLDCIPAIPTIRIDARYEYDMTTRRLDEVLVKNHDTGATITRRPIKFKSETSSHSEN